MAMLTLIRCKNVYVELSLNHSVTSLVSIDLNLLTSPILNETTDRNGSNCY